MKEADWDRDIASLDSAILALLEASTPEDVIAESLQDVLDGSLFSRQLVQYEEAAQKLIRGFVVARAKRIWDQTSEPQRTGYHAAGIGLTAGQFLDANLPKLVELLVTAEASIAGGDSEAAASAIIAFAELVFQTAPFQAHKALPASWQSALTAWMQGRSSAEVIAMCPDGVDLLQETLAYRLPWAMEAVRVHAVAMSNGAASITGLAALAVEAGSSNQSVIVLLRSGLSSREAAFAAVASSGASFDDRSGMLMWLRSDEVENLHLDESWPSPQSRHAWVQFYEGEMKGDRRKWSRETQRVRVQWADETPDVGTHVVLEPGGKGGLVLSPAFELLGTLVTTLKRPRRDIVQATVGEKPGGTVDVDYFGPKARA